MTAQTAFHRPHRLLSGRPLAAALLALACAAPAGAQQAAVDFGEPSVLSQRGQRLKVVVPYGSNPGERLSATRFEVVSVQAPDGWQAPDPAAFTVSKPSRRNLVYLQSSEYVDAPELTFAVRVAGEPGEPQSWTIALPPARASVMPTSLDTAARPAARPKSKARRTPASTQTAR
jgi:hypothetical protein